MTEKQQLRSEGEELEGLLNELEKEHTIREISGWQTGFPNLGRALASASPRHIRRLGSSA
jgi:hypothetical protein